MNNLYPLKFKPVFKDKIWGGNKIKKVLGLDYGNLPNCGEAWVVSGYMQNESVVSNGFLSGNSLNELTEIYMGDLVGDEIFERFGDEFPLLIKFLDSNDWLSIQVHPDDDLSRKRKMKNGKSEMWYVIDAEEDAELITGFNRKVNKEFFLKHLENKTLKEILNFEKVKKGDVFYLPAGRVHALGPGILLAEIQQSSDATYRIYDWDRIDATGLKRELHTELALDAIDFGIYDDYKIKVNEKLNQTTHLVHSPYFTTNLINLNKPLSKDYEELDSFVVYLFLEGEGLLKWSGQTLPVKKGEAVLVPNMLNLIDIYPEGRLKFLEIYIA